MDLEFLGLIKTNIKDNLFKEGAKGVLSYNAEKDETIFESPRWDKHIDYSKITDTYGKIDVNKLLAKQDFKDFLLQLATDFITLLLKYDTEAGYSDIIKQIKGRDLVFGQDSINLGITLGTLCDKTFTSISHYLGIHLDPFTVYNPLAFEAVKLIVI